MPQAHMSESEPGHPMMRSAYSLQEGTPAGLPRVLEVTASVPLYHHYPQKRPPSPAALLTEVLKVQKLRTVFKPKVLRMNEFQAPS